MSILPSTAFFFEPAFRTFEINAFCAFERSSRWVANPTWTASDSSGWFPPCSFWLVPKPLNLFVDRFSLRVQKADDLVVVNQFSDVLVALRGPLGQLTVLLFRKGAEIVLDGLVDDAGRDGSVFVQFGQIQQVQVLHRSQLASAQCRLHFPVFRLSFVTNAFFLQVRQIQFEIVEFLFLEKVLSTELFVRDAGLFSVESTRSLFMRRLENISFFLD